MIPRSICLSGSFHLTSCPPGLAMLLQKAGFIFYGWIILYIYVYIYLIHISQSFFILVILNHAVMSVGECASLPKILISFPWPVHPEVKLLDHKVILFIIFWGISILFSTEAEHIYMRTKNAPISLFSTSPYYRFDKGHSNWCELISHCGFDLHFSRATLLTFTLKTYLVLLHSKCA